MLFLSFLSPVEDGFTSNSRLSLRLWSQSLSFEHKHQSSKRWPKRPRSGSPLEVVSIYIASFRCKLHCPCRITRTTTDLSSPLDVSPAKPSFMRRLETPHLCSSWLTRKIRDPSLALRMTAMLSLRRPHCSITTGVPSSTISNNSITSSLRILTQP